MLSGLLRYGRPGRVSAVLALVAAAPMVPETVTVPQRDAVRSHIGAATASLSADGRLVAFMSYARLAPTDVDERADVYLLDRAAGAVEHLSTGLVGGRRIGSDSVHPRVSADGRYVVFQTTFPGASLQTADYELVLYEAATGLLHPLLSSIDGPVPDGWSSSAAVNADGSAIAFASTATNLTAASDLNGSQADIYVVRPRERVIRRVSVDSAGAQMPGLSVTPSISDDGTRVAFTSTADLVRDEPATRRTGAARPVARIFVRDLVQHRTFAVPRTPLDGPSMGPAISGDGRFVAFASTATRLAPDDRNRSSDVFLYELATGLLTLVSRGARGRPASGSSFNPAVSRDGRFVAFQSDASDVGCSERCAEAFEDINLLSDVFLFDKLTGTILRVSTGPDAGWMEESAAPALDAAARTVAFSSRHPIRPGDLAHDFDLFVRPLPSGR